MHMSGFKNVCLGLVFQKKRVELGANAFLYRSRPLPYNLHLNGKYLAGSTFGVAYMDGGARRLERGLLHKTVAVYVIPL